MKWLRRPRPRNRTRTLTPLMVMLLLLAYGGGGAIINVAVAWHCATWITYPNNPNEEFVPPANADTLARQWFEMSASDPDRTARATTLTTKGRRFIRVGLASSDPRPSEIQQMPYAEIFEYGWPFRSMLGVVRGYIQHTMEWTIRRPTWMTGRGW